MYGTHLRIDESVEMCAQFFRPPLLAHIRDLVVVGVLSGQVADHDRPVDTVPRASDPLLLLLSIVGVDGYYFAPGEMIEGVQVAPQIVLAMVRRVPQSAFEALEGLGADLEIPLRVQKTMFPRTGAPQPWRAPVV